MRRQVGAVELGALDADEVRHEVERGPEAEEQRSALW